MSAIALEHPLNSRPAYRAGDVNDYLNSSASDNIEELLSDESPELMSYHQLLIAEDPAQAFAEIKDQPSKVEAFLHEAEMDVAEAAADLDTGRRTEKEKSDLGYAIEGYTTLMGLISKEKLKSQLAEGKSEATAKRSLVKDLIESKRRILYADTEKRFDISTVERAKEKLGATKLKRTVGRLAMDAVVLGSIYSGWKYGVGGIPDQLAINSDVPEAVGFLSAGWMTKTIGSIAIKRLIKGVEQYARKETVPDRNEAVEVTEAPFIKHDSHLQDTEKQLYGIAGANVLEEVDEENLVVKVMDTFKSSFYDFYGIKSEKKKFEEAAELAATSLIVGSTEADGGDRETINSAAEAIVHFE